MKYKKLFLLLPLLASFSCGGNNELKTKCPLGAPSLVFYDQGNNENFETTSATATILAEFQKNEYDAIVIDSTSGLNAIKKYYSTSPYRFAKLLTNGNLYMVSHTKSDFDITSENSVCVFGSLTGVPYLTLRSIYPNFVDGKITRLDGLNQVVARLSNNPYEFDYYVLAEPALTKVKKDISLTAEKKFELGGGLAIPQAALFINKNSYNNKKDKFTEYLNNLKTRIDVCINNPTIFKESLNKYGDDSKVSQRFGFTSDVAYEVQDGKNGFAVYPYESSFTCSDMNKFMVTIGQEGNYKEEYFINVE